MKKIQRLLGRVMMVGLVIFFIQCETEETISGNAYVPKTPQEENIQGNKLAVVALKNGGSITFWEFKEAVAMNVVQPENAEQEFDAEIAGLKSYAAIYEHLAKQPNQVQLKAIQVAEQRIREQPQQPAAAISVYPPSQKPIAGGKTAISYGCAVSSASTGAGFAGSWKNAGYDYADCEVNTDYAYTYGTNLSYVKVATKTHDNASITIERWWNGSYRELLRQNTYSGNSYAWTITYYSDPVDYIAAYASPKNGVDCPKVHLCMVGNY